MMSQTTILLVDDHPVVREGYRRLLERHPSFRVVAEAENASEAFQTYRKVSPTVVVMDITMPGPSGLEAIRHIRQWDKRARILVFTMHQGSVFALKAFDAGASGYITKSSPPAELLRAVATVAAGGRALSEDVAQELAAERLGGRYSAVNELTPREVEILRLVASGKTKDAISDILCLSPKTVQNYYYGMKAKLGTKTAAQLVKMAVEVGLLKITDIEGTQDFD